jgi:hypothetical protein
MLWYCHGCGLVVCDVDAAHPRSFLAAADATADLFKLLRSNAFHLRAMVGT